MKVTRNTPDQLIVGSNPIWVAALLGVMATAFAATGLPVYVFADEAVGLALVLAALLPVGLMFVFVRRVQLIFEAGKATLTVQRKSLLGAKKVVHDLADVQGAEVETSRADGATLRRVTLLMGGQSAGRHPVTRFYSNVGRHREVAQAINDWLDSARPPA